MPQCNGPSGNAIGGALNGKLHPPHHKHWCSVQPHAAKMVWSRTGRLLQWGHDKGGISTSYSSSEVSPAGVHGPAAQNMRGSCPGVHIKWMDKNRLCCLCNFILSQPYRSLHCIYVYTCTWKGMFGYTCRCAFCLMGFTIYPLLLCVQPSG